MSQDLNNIERDAWKNPDYSVMAKFSLAGKKGFVTGAAGGIGRNVAAAWAEAGADVVLVDMASQEDRLKDLVALMADKYGRQIDYALCDITDADQVTALRQDLVDKLGTIDLAFINAGINVLGDNLDIALAEWQKTVDVNLTGSFLTAQLAHQVMRDHDHGGSIILVSSISGDNVNLMAGGPTENFAYSATKGGINQMGRHLAASLAPHDIRVNMISPGYTWTDIFDGRINQAGADMMLENVPMKRFGLTEEIQGAAVFLASDAAAYITGVNLHIDGGYSVH
ncbi:hypothetical protein AWM75_07950 [Aerococcus urinaehominis]|uniref:Uncharacterized protein n=1 Tax=Aerococcus urinaehominis TaxID=128944 RepID=A0A0X8FMA8_9LACT|nr:SDR family oxidoreductase [Aerococcus urinaehominis]AMB99905.1 hypothetical protein AWM75_07950 [Aerococcus urinaehominis]SDM52359.1 NAD(P)-dependent dehydrogenase, short-chain alcohol dehydrogenase family [Aerococcus urinaehominis]